MLFLHAKLAYKRYAYIQYHRQYHAYIRNVQREYIYGEIEYNYLLAGIIPQS